MNKNLCKVSMTSVVILFLITGMVLFSVNNGYCEEDKPNNLVDEANDNDTKIGIGWSPKLLFSSQHGYLLAYKGINGIYVTSSLDAVHWRTHSKVIDHPNNDSIRFFYYPYQLIQLSNGSYILFYSWGYVPEKGLLIDFSSIEALISNDTINWIEHNVSGPGLLWYTIETLDKRFFGLEYVTSRIYSSLDLKNWTYIASLDTWLKAIIETRNDGVALIGFDRYNKTYHFYVSSDGVYFKISKLPIEESSRNITTSFALTQTISGNFSIVYTIIEDNVSKGIYALSSNDGENWSLPHKIIEVEVGNVYSVATASGNDGKWVVAYELVKNDTSYIYVSVFGEVVPTSTPNPILNVSPPNVYTNDEVTFNASNSFDDDGEIIAYFFDFGEGSNTGWIRKRAITYNYSNNGVYSPKLKVKDNMGIESGEYTVQVIVKNRMPIPSVTVDKEIVNISEKIRLDASGSLDPDGKIVEYTWDLGDGEISHAQIIEHTYRKPGTYVVILNVTDDDGATTKTSIIITVKEEKISFTNYALLYAICTIILILGIAGSVLFWLGIRKRI